MALQTSGAISLANVQSEFGSSNPIGINEYYRSGSNVPNSSANSSIPTSGTISLSNFYGGTATSVDNTFNFTMDSGSSGGKISFTEYGASNNIAYLNNIGTNNTVTTNNLAVSETIIQFRKTINIGSPLNMNTSASGGGDRLWNQGNVRGFSMNGTTYPFVQPASGSDFLSTVIVPIATVDPLDGAMGSLIGQNVVITLTY